MQLTSAEQPETKAHRFTAKLVGIAIALMLVPASSWGRVIYVDQSATGLATGTSWRNAYPDLQAALAVALANDRVWLARGTYHPTTTNDILQSFAIPSRVVILGGFSGDETLESQRNPIANRTALSGDLGDDDSYANPWWSGFSVNTPNSKHVVTITDAQLGTELNGLEILGGNAVQTTGGGILALRSTFDVRDCKFTHNLGYQGAGTCIAVSGGHLTLSTSTFTENWGRFQSGVGLWTSGTASATIDRCTFYQNVSEADTSLGEGAGIALEGTGSSVITSSKFVENIAHPLGGQYISFGGAVYNSQGPLQVDRCTFISNESVRGGAIYSWVGMTISNSLFQSNRANTSGIFSGNGGAVAIFGYNPYTLKMAGCTVVNNRAHETAGVWANGNSTVSLDVSSCIFWGNQDINGTVSQTSVKKASNSCVQNMLVTIPGEDPIDPAKFPQSIDLDPQFADFQNDFHLTKLSPCIDAGNKNKFDSSWLLDADHLRRFMDMPFAPNSGVGSSPLPDMGCYEMFDVLASPPIELSVIIGSQMSGTLQELSFADKSYLYVSPTPLQNGQEKEYLIETVHLSPVSHPGSLEFIVQSRYLANLKPATLKAFNFDSGLWEDVQLKTVDLSLGTQVGFVKNNASRFVSGGVIRLRIGARSPNLTLNKGQSASFDQIEVRLTY